MTMDVSTQNSSHQNGVVQSREDGANGAPSRIAHTLTACCRCRTVRTTFAGATTSPPVY